MSTQESSITWHAPEFRHYEKNVGWYVTFASASLLIIGFFAIDKDYFAAVTTAILAGLVIFFAQQRPEIVEVHLGNRGVRIGHIFYPFKQIKHFWIVHNNHHKTLNLITTTYINNVVIIELEDQDPESIREFLINHLPEHTETEPTAAQRIMHRVKF